MRIMLGIALGLASVILAVGFVSVAVTKIGSGYWFGYVAMFAYGMGAIGCFISARRLIRARPAVVRGR